MPKTDRSKQVVLTSAVVISLLGSEEWHKVNVNSTAVPLPLFARYTITGYFSAYVSNISPKWETASARKSRTNMSNLKIYDIQIIASFPP